MKTKKRFKIFGGILTFLILFVPLISFADGVNNCDKSIYTCAEVGLFINMAMVMFLLSFLWIVSPIGIVFFIASKFLLSHKSSWIKRKTAWFFQVLAIFVWASIMSLLLIMYIDSVLYQILDIGGKALSLLIGSGAIFALVMFFVMMLEKKAGNAIEKNSKKKRNNKTEYRTETKTENNVENKSDDKAKDKTKRKKEDVIKFAGIEVSGVKSKIKEEIKEIIDGKIDKL